jgi:hypothetical protein
VTHPQVSLLDARHGSASLLCSQLMSVENQHLLQIVFTIPVLQVLLDRRLALPGPERSSWQILRSPCTQAGIGQPET